jgi:hypothetical protein
LGNIRVPENCARECFSGGKALKAPANVVVLIVTAARNVMICNPALAVKLVHVIKAATEQQDSASAQGDAREPHMKLESECESMKCTSR